MRPKAEALGSDAFAAGSDAGLSPERLPLAEVDVARDMRDAGPGFGRRIARDGARDVPKDDTAPAWSARLDGAPIVYLTLGTIYNIESGTLLERVAQERRPLASP